MIAVIIYSIITAESFGDIYIEELRIADSNNTIKELSDKTSIELGKEVCSNTVNWINEESSLLSIQKILTEYGINVKSDNRIIPIIRFQSIYELCPENINALENIFKNNE